MNARRPPQWKSFALWTGLLGAAGCATAPPAVEETQKGVDAAIYAERSAFYACYGDVVAKLPRKAKRPAGVVVTSFTVDFAGRAASPQVISSGLHLPAVEDCVLRTLRAVKFPRPESTRAVGVVFPFEFGAPGGPETP